MYTLIIADDEIETRDNMIACMNWESLGIQVIGTADSGPSAYELIRTEKPDLALIDIRMPGMSGLDVIRKIREEGKTDTLFIILSGYDSFQYAQQAVDYQVHKYLLKPFSINELSDALRKAINVLPGSAASSTEIREEKDSTPPLHYPIEMETAVINCIAAGQQDTLSRHINSFVDAVCRANPTEIGRLHCAMMLYSAMCKMLIQCGRSFSVNHFSQLENTEHAGRERIRRTLNSACTEAMNAVQETRHSNHLIRLAILYIENHYSEKLSLNSIADQIHISPVYLSNLFTKVVGKSITEYLQGLRVEHAKRFLMATELSVSEIAQKVGYSDVKYFVKIFKRLTGLTPSSFKNQTEPNTQSVEDMNRNKNIIGKEASDANSFHDGFPLERI